MITASDLQEKAPAKVIPVTETLAEARPLTNRAREKQRFNAALIVSLCVLAAVIATGIAIL